VASASAVPANPPPLRHCGLHGRAQHHGATIKPLRLAGGYRIASSTTPARERPRPGFVALRNRCPGTTDFYAVRAWVRTARRLRRRPKSRPTASSATSKQHSGALRARGTNAGLG